MLNEQGQDKVFRGQKGETAALLNPIENGNVADLLESNVTGEGVKEDFFSIRGKLTWFRLVHPKGLVKTERVSIDNQTFSVVYRAEIFGNDGNLLASATGSARYDEKYRTEETAESRAIGRALDFAGFGCQLSISDSDEADELPDTTPKDPMLENVNGSSSPSLPKVTPPPAPTPVVADAPLGVLPGKPVGINGKNVVDVHELEGPSNEPPEVDKNQTSFEDVMAPQTEKSQPAKDVPVTVIPSVEELPKAEKNTPPPISSMAQPAVETATAILEDNKRVPVELPQEEIVVPVLDKPTFVPPAKIADVNVLVETAMAQIPDENLTLDVSFFTKNENPSDIYSQENGIKTTMLCSSIQKAIQALESIPNSHWSVDLASGSRALISEENPEGKGSASDIYKYAPERCENTLNVYRKNQFGNFPIAIAAMHLCLKDLTSEREKQAS